MSGWSVCNIVRSPDCSYDGENNDNKELNYYHNSTGIGFLEFLVKKAFTLLLLILGIATLCLANSTHYAIASGNWNATTTWSNTSAGAAGIDFPVAGDAVYIAEATTGTTLITITIPTGITAACASLTFGPVGTTGPRPGTLAFTDATSILNVSGNVTMYRPSSSTATKTITLGAGAMNVTGNLSMGLSGATTGTTRVSAITISTGTLTIGGNLAFNATSATQNKITFSGAGTLNIGGNFTGTFGTLTPGTASTVNFNGAGAQAVPIAVSSIIYCNLNFAGAGTKTLRAAISATNVTGNISVNGGTLANGGFAIVGNAAKSFTVANGATLSLTGTTTMPTGFGTITTNPTSTVNYAGSTQSITSRTYGHLTFSLAGNKTAAGALTVAGDFTLTAGTFVAGAFTHNIAGNFSITGTFTQGTSTLNFNGTAAQTIGGTTTTFNLVTINNPVGVTLNVATTATTVTVASGSILNKGAFALTGALNNNGTVKSSVAALASGTVTHGTNSTVEYTAAVAIPAGTAYKNITLSGTGIYTLGGAVTLANTLTVSAASTLNKSATVITGALSNYGIVQTSVLAIASGTVTHNTGSTIDYTAALSLPASTGYYHLTLSAAGHYYLTGNVTGIQTLTLGLTTYLDTQNKTLGYATLAGDITHLIVEAPPSIGTPSSASITINSALLGGDITDVNNANVTVRGIYYSTTNGFADGAGTPVSETGTFAAGAFTVNVSGLTQGTTYYFKAFATNSWGTTYTTQASFATLTHTITLGSTNPAVVASDVPQNAMLIGVYRFTLASANAASTLNTVAFTTAGTYVAADLTNLRLWYNSLNAFGSSTQIGSTLTTALGAGSHTFSSLTQGIAGGATGYFWITVDVAASAIVGHTLSVDAITTSNLTFVAGQKTGTAYAGGVKTVFYDFFDESFETFPFVNWTNSGVTQVADPLSGYGTYAANFPVSGSTEYYLYTPLLAKPNNMTYWIKSGSGSIANPVLKLQYSTDTLIWTDISTRTATSTYTTYSEDLSAYTNVYIRFLKTTNSGSDMTILLDDVDLISRAPTAQATAMHFDDIQTNQITLSWIRGNGTSCVVFLMQGEDGYHGDPLDGTTYTASTDWNIHGTEMGTTAHYCVYNGTGTSVNITNLLAGTTYHAVVYEYYGSDATSHYMNVGSTSDGITLPSPATLTAPTSDSTGLGYDGQTLSWSAGTGGAPTGYKVYFGTTTPPTTLVSTSAGTTYATGTLSQNQIYYWQILPFNVTGDALSCPVWSFTTRTELNPGVATTPVPGTGATAYTDFYPYTQTISWTAPSGTPAATGYKVYIGTDGSGTSTPTNIDDGTPQSELSTQFSVTAAGTYYWQIMPYYTDPGTKGVTYGKSISAYITNSNSNSIRGDATGCPIWSFSSAPPTITLASNNPAVAASIIYCNTTKNPLYRFTLTAANAAANLNSVTFTTTGTNVVADLSNLKLWYKNSDDLATASQIGFTNAYLGLGTDTFSGLNQTIASGATGYFWITADLPTETTFGNTIAVAAMATGDLTFTIGNKSGSASAGGVQTITYKSETMDYFRTISAGNWESPAIWQSSHDDTNWHSATLKPTGSATMVYLNHSVTLSLAEACSALTFNAGGAVSLGNNNFTVSGTVTGTPMITYNGSGATSGIAYNANPPDVNVTIADPASLPPVVVALEVTSSITVAMPNNVSTAALTLSGGGALALNGNTLTFTGQDASFTGTNTITALSVAFTTPTLLPTHVNKRWTISGSVGSLISTTLTWTAAQDGGFDWTGNSPAVYQGMVKYAATGYDVIDDPRSITVNLPASLSKGTIEIGTDSGGTLPVELSSFTALPLTQSSVRVEWITQSETGVLGFYIYRNDIDNINNANLVSPLIPATNSSTETAYSFMDKELPGNGTYYYWLQNQDIDGTNNFYGPISTIVNIDNPDAPVIPLVTSLAKPYPNPFNPSVTIAFGLAKAEHVQINVYNSKGQKVITLIDTHKNPGLGRIVWTGTDANGRSLSSGVYFIKMIAGKYNSTQKAFLLK